MNRYTNRPKRRHGRRGVLTLELVLGLPLVLIVLLALVEFAMLLSAAQAVSAAAQVAAREASLPGTTRADVEQAVARVLAPWRFAGAVEPVVIDPPQLELARPGDPVAVTVKVPSQAAAPNLLKIIGISLVGRELSTTYVARHE